MDVYIECCSLGAQNLPELSATVHASPGAAGLRIRDLCEFAERVLDEHRYCPHAPPHMLDDGGIVRTQLYFKGNIVLQSDDPYLLEEVERGKEWADCIQRMNVRAAKVSAYTNAKVKGRRPISCGTSRYIQLTYVL